MHATKKSMRTTVLGWALTLFFILSLTTRSTAASGGSTGDARGVVVDVSGVAVEGARVTLRAGALELRAVSDAAGHFTLEGVTAATYVVSAEARGYAPLSDRLVTIVPGVTTNLVLRLARSSAGTITTLGSVTVNGRQSISTASSPTAVVDPQRLAALGDQNVTDSLGQQIALTMTHPAGGAPGLPQSASLRGPDPAETLIDIDGHIMNNANTGDFDLELLDPSEFSNIQVVYGVGPATLGGANTQGGTINFHTLDPTLQDHGLVRLTAGSFDTSAYTLQATGTADQRLGYALSVHHYYSAGAVNDYPITFQPSPSSGLIDQTTIGSAINASSMLGKLRYGFGSSGGYVEATYWNTLAYRDLSAPLSFPDVPQSFEPGSLFTAFPGASASSISPAYALDVQLPLGNRGSTGIAPSALTLRHLTSTIDQSTPNIPPGYNSYLLDDQDQLADDSAEWNRTLSNATLSAYVDLRHERLRMGEAAPLARGVDELSQTQQTYAVRGAWDPTSHLHYSAVLYFSDYSTFGSSTDPRLAIVWTPTADSMVRASFGTGFTPPTLTQTALNPDLTTEHTDEYELGYQHHFGASVRSAMFEADAYYTAVRNPIFFTPSTNPALGQFSYVANIGDVVYSGVEVRAQQPISSAATLSASYGVDLAYPVTNPAAVDPRAPWLQPQQQFQGIPPHKALLTIDGRAVPGLGYSVSAGWEAENNELNRPSFWLYGANITEQISHTQLAISAQNIGNIFANKFTLVGMGPLYPTQTGLMPTNAYSLPGFTFGFTVTQRL